MEIISLLHCGNVDNVNGCRLDIGWIKNLLLELVRTQTQVAQEECVLEHGCKNQNFNDTHTRTCIVHAARRTARTVSTCTSFMSS